METENKGEERQMTVAILLVEPVWNLPLPILITCLQHGLKLDLRRALLSCFCGLSSLFVSFNLHPKRHAYRYPRATEGRILFTQVAFLSDPAGGRNTPNKYKITHVRSRKSASRQGTHWWAWSLLAPAEDRCWNTGKMTFWFSLCGRMLHLCCWYFRNI